MKIKEIVWSRGQYSTKGTVGGYPIFNFGWNGTISKGDPDAEKKKYYLGINLPGIVERRHCESEEKCQVLASEILAHFISKIVTE